MTRKDDRRQLECHRKGARMSNKDKTTEQLASVEQGRKRVAHVLLQQCAAAPIARFTRTPTEQPNSVAREVLATVRCTMVRSRKFRFLNRPQT